MIAMQSRVLIQVAIIDQAEFSPLRAILNGPHTAAFLVGVSLIFWLVIRLGEAVYVWRDVVSSIEFTTTVMGIIVVSIIWGVFGRQKC